MVRAPIIAAVVALAEVVSASASAQEAPPEAAPFDVPTPHAELPAPSVTADVPEPVKRLPNAGYHNGFFYLRDATDSFRFYPQGRLHIDGYVPLGRGVTQLPAGSSMNPGFFIRRARVEFSAEFKKWQAVMMAELGPTTIDNTNARGATLDCVPDAATREKTCSPRSSAVDSPAQRAAIINGYINYAAASWFNAQVGQFRIPFTLEHRTGVNVIPFLDRSMTVRLVGPPTGRDLGAMVWGDGPSRTFHYGVALLTGDGADRTNVDARFDGTGRIVVRPFATSDSSLLKDLQIGGSLRGGSRDNKLVGYDVSPLTTQGGYAYWRPTYRDAQQKLIHIIPSGLQLAYAGEVYAPLGRFDVTGEMVGINHHTREAEDGFQLTGTSARFGAMRGFGYYAHIGIWALGGREVLPKPGYMGPPHVDFTKTIKLPEHSLQLVARWEQIRIRYSGADREGVGDAKTPDGDIRVDALGLGANYFFTRHIRVTLNYFHYWFPSSAPTTPSSPGAPQQTANQRAVAPAQGLDKGVDDDARNSAHGLHEVNLRVALQF